jgi:hypothetical protein
MAIDYQKDWDRRLRQEFGGDRDRLYEALLGELSGSYMPREAFGATRLSNEYLSGISAADIGEYFVDPKLAESRRNFEGALDRGYKQGLRGAGSRLAREQQRLGVPEAGAITRMEGSIGRPEGLAASSSRAQKLQEHEEALMSNPNLYAPIANISSGITGEHEKHAGRAKGASAGMKAASAIFSALSAVNPAFAAAAAGFGVGAGATDLATAELGRKATKQAAKFNPGLWQASRKAYSDPGAGMGLNYSPFGSREGALGNIYGRPRKRRSEEEDYLFGGYT